ncbi:hypothetical protein [Phytoactinopolyspora limicola]|uniref:hypothetical protein n=1 Tax=Phytoactinopolyspora limicola TaxID=2715536 RepID=UPI00140CB517|nr:hypothetical protein [Phytoactinopolyspora limicola]
MRAVYLRPVGVQSWSARELMDRLDTFADSGIDTIVTKLRASTGRFAAECRARNIRLVGSFGCFIDHALPSDVPPELRPVDDHGRVFEPMRWYHGVIPTSERYLEALAAELSAVLDHTDTDGVLLDFIRWPCHWERELRPGATWRRSSFDPITLARFNTYLDGRDDSPHLAVDPGDPVQAAAAVRDHLAEQWIEFRCDVVNDACRRLGDVVAAAGRWTGAFVVPTTDRLRREVVGQDTRALAEIVDLLLPMTYHAALQRPVSWLDSVSADVKATTTGTPGGAPVVAMVQGPATEDGWGISPGSPQFRDALTAATTWPGSGAGFCVFPGDEFGPDEFVALRDAPQPTP